MVLREILGDGHAIFPHEQQAVAILVNLHLIAGADPTPEFGFCLFIRIEVAGAQGLAEFIHVGGEPLDDRLGDRGIRMKGGPALLSESFHKPPHSCQGRLIRFGHGASSWVADAASLAASKGPRGRQFTSTHAFFTISSFI